MRKIKLRVLAALSYVPFGIALSFFSIHILIKIALILLVTPSVIMGLKSSKRNDIWEQLHFVFDCWLQPWTRIVLALIGILTVLTLGTVAWLLVLSIILSLMPLIVWASKKWFYAIFGAILEEENANPIFRR